jgi:hypothetical protein
MQYTSFLIRAISVPFAVLYIENAVLRAICCAVSCCMYVFTRIRVLPEEPFYAVNMRLRVISNSGPLWQAGPVLPVCYHRAGISSLRFKLLPS